MKILWVSFFIITLDRLSKTLIKHYLDLHESILVIGPDFFRLSYIENFGIVFGWSFGNIFLRNAFTIIAVILLLFYFYNQRQAPIIIRFPLALIIGGALGNLWDRLVYGSVIDFLDFDFPNFIHERFPVFNIADSSITTGMTILVIYIVFFDKHRKTISLEVKDDIAAGGDINNSFSASKEGTD
ncbi:signal peptidase II [bacterium]|nr:signal peptidase II [FCB group bacterium]MBL7190172.1 signal peptidase II [bacterium]